MVFVVHQPNCHFPGRFLGQKKIPALNGKGRAKAQPECNKEAYSSKRIIREITKFIDC